MTLNSCSLGDPSAHYKHTQDKHTLDEINWLLESELFQSIGTIDKTKPFEEKISLLSKNFTKTESGSYEMWLSLSDTDSKYALFSIEKGKFHSSIFEKKSIDPQHNDFHFIALFKDEKIQSAKKPLLEIRSSLDGDIGEILQINKSETLTGTEIINFYKRLQDFLGIKKVWLYDTAKIRNFDMAEYLPVAHKSPVGFYRRKLRFKVADFSKKPCRLRAGIISFQSRKSFKKAVNYMRSYKTSTLLIHLKDKQIKKRLDKIIATIDLDQDPSNLHQIVYKVFQRAVYSGNYNDFDFVKTTFLPNFNEKKVIINAPQSYYRHLRIMQNSRIYCKDYEKKKDK